MAVEEPASTISWPTDASHVRLLTRKDLFKVFADESESFDLGVGNSQAFFGQILVELTLTVHKRRERGARGGPQSLNSVQFISDVLVLLQSSGLAIDDLVEAERQHVRLAAPLYEVREHLPPYVGK